MRGVFPILLALTLLGCATTKYPPPPPPPPPPSIKDGYYLNPEYQFSVKVPEGWQVSHEIPDRLKKIFVGYEEKSIPVLFLNIKRAGLIYIYVQKFQLYEIVSDEIQTYGSLVIPSYRYMYNIFRERLYSDLDKRQKAMESNPSVIDYSVNLGHECEFTETILVEDPDSLDIYKQMGIGTCYHHKDHFYYAELTLDSWSHTFGENYEVYKEFIKHFKTGNLMYGKDEAEK